MDGENDFSNLPHILRELKRILNNSQPQWYTCAEVTVDLNEVAAVQPWVFNINPSAARGVRFILKCGAKVDTLTMDQSIALDAIYHARIALEHARTSRQF